MRKLGKIETRAASYCETVRRDGRGSFTVDWPRSATWGRTARVQTHEGTAARASGCGYCKESSVLADLLHPLGATNEERRSIHATGGAGVPAVERALRAAGWILEKVATGKTFDAYTVTRA